MARREKPKSLLAQRLKRLTPRPFYRFAEKLGFRRKRYYAWLAGERPPDPALAGIARALGISMDDLLAPAAGPDEAQKLPDGPSRPLVPVVGRMAAGPLAPTETLFVVEPTLPETEK